MGLPANCGVLHLKLVLLLLVTLSSGISAQLTPGFYSKSCPKVATVVRSVVKPAVQKEARMAASLLRLHFHDCFVHGCDGSVLLDDTPTVIGEKEALPNNNSLRGFDVVDNIKSAVEAACPATVSCADILAIAAQISVRLVGGPTWTVLLGRRDATTPATRAEAQAALPNPNSDFSIILGQFAAVNLTAKDTVVLSGAHTIGLARCAVVTQRLYNFSGTAGQADPSIDPAFLATLQRNCPQGGNASVLNPLDLMTPTRFDKAYYTNLQQHKGFLRSDQELTAANSTAALAQTYASSQIAFFNAFGSSMVNMGNISPLTGSQGQIRLHCRVPNP